MIHPLECFRRASLELSSLQADDALFRIDSGSRANKKRREAEEMLGSGQAMIGCDICVFELVCI